MINNPKVDLFLKKTSKWKTEMTLLREIILSVKELAEDYKWMHPCYTYEGSNIVLIHGFKEYCALLFHKGVLLNDPENILIQQTKNVQSARQIRFTCAAEIKKLRPVIKAYIKDAVTIEKKGLKVTLKQTADYTIPEEFKEKLAENTALEKAFNALTPGRQRGYLFFFSQAKMVQTRLDRIGKYIPKIMEGKGIDD